MTAALNVAIMYNFGQGTTQDYQKAFQWYEKAAKVQKPIAQNNLAQLYFEAARC